MQHVSHPHKPRVLTLLGVVLVILSLVSVPSNGQSLRSQVIVRGQSLAATQAAVVAVGGTLIQPLALIDGVSASLTPAAEQRLRAQHFIVTPDHAVSISNGDEQDAVAEEDGEGTPLTNDPLIYPAVATGVDQVDKRWDGDGVTIAFIDSGFPAFKKARDWERVDDKTLYADKGNSFIVYRDQLATAPISNSSDPYGHGTHVVMTVADGNEVRSTGTNGKRPAGIAPESDLVMVRALDQNGQGTYTNVIAALDWIVSHRSQYNIKVLNLSLDGIPSVPYWYDPLGVAVMRAWQSGLVVVASAGNRGPNPVTIGVPGNVPYIITVGAIKNAAYNASGRDELAAYSSAGPTESKFIKPDILISASRTIAAMGKNSLLATSPQARKVVDNDKPRLNVGSFESHDLAYYQLSGTSMAAAEMSGLVALLLQRQPQLTNNQVKYRLTSTANPAVNGQVAQYSVWQQGAGRANPVAAVNGSSTQSANAGMNIGLDLLGEAPNAVHYLGDTAFDQATNRFYLQSVGPGSYGTWTGSYGTWTGNYGTWTGSNGTWTGNYGTWTGNYGTWTGNYGTWTGSYGTWTGTYGTWTGQYGTWTGSSGGGGGGSNVVIIAPASNE